jgi:hypothetical protein
MVRKPRPATYSVHPGIATVQNWVEALKAKTGRSLEEWLALVEAEGPATAAARSDWLKTHFGLGTNAAAWIAGRSLGQNA